MIPRCVGIHTGPFASDSSLTPTLTNARHITQSAINIDIKNRYALTPRIKMTGPTVAQVIVRNLDETVVKALKARAALHGQSLEQELRDILAEACDLSGADRLALTGRIRALQSTPLDSGTEALIRKDRDRL